MNLTKTIKGDLKIRIEAAVKEQIDPLFSEKPVMEKWFRLLLTENSAKRFIKRLYSGQPSELIVLCTDPKAKKSMKETTLLKAFSYLLSVEVEGNFVIDLFILMMVAKGNDFHIEPDFSHKFIRHVTSLADLIVIGNTGSKT